MYQVLGINDLLCYFSRSYLDVSIRNCELYSIWRAPLCEEVTMAEDFVMNSLLNCEEMFPFVFYYVLAISAIGTFHYIIEFLEIILESQGKYLLRFYKPRDITVFSDRQLRRFRLVGNFFMINAWLLLLYAVVFMKPQFILPWRMMSTTSVLIDGFFLLLDVLIKRRMCSLSSLVFFLFPFFNMSCVLCVKSSFKRIEDQSNLENLTWW
ncbi:uncharacterized protein LOC108094580 [Drosophila ficusphila]|uniref:uncharacterized protein LOC108094580 n=1 Tax=Drosophila ficusphila TaxID=30025 RepID=UPI0007E67CE1|nr:uncharacterized protein LOC108094580 [Drosophila ficusphila]